MLRAAVLAFALVAAPALCAASPGLNAGDVAEIRALIERQIEASQRDDARGACAVDRPASIAFLRLVLFDDDAVQQVALVDRSGAVRLAYYAMQRQRDGSWRASGCHLVAPAKTIPT